MSKIVGTILVAVMLVVFFYFLKVGIEKTEEVECLKWQVQAKEYPLFYLTKWQAEQCQALKIDITTTIR